MDNSVDKDSYLIKDSIFTSLGTSEKLFRKVMRYNQTISRRKVYILDFV